MRSVERGAARRRPKQHLANLQLMAAHGVSPAETKRHACDTMYDNPSGIQPRKHLRLIITLPLKFFVDKEAVARDGMVIDVGAGGMHFDSRHRFADSSALRLVFGLRPGRQFELQGPRQLRVG